MALSEVDKQQIAAFLGSILKGTAELGWAALPLLKLYAAAKNEHVSIPDLLMRDPEATAVLVAALKRNARKLPPSVIAGLEQIVLAAKAPA